MTKKDKFANTLFCNEDNASKTKKKSPHFKDLEKLNEKNE
jgi:hypothetical protein